MINIGTNFLYKGILFLDDRQGIARSKSDLKNWDYAEVPIPAGFEVYLNTENDPAWYTYKPAPNGVDDEETGWFERRLDKSYVDSQIEIINTQITNIWHGSKDGLGGIEEIWEAINNIHFDIPTTYSLDASGVSTGNHLPSQYVEPKINWGVKKTVWGQSGTTTVPYTDIDSVKISIDGAAAEEVPHVSPWKLGSTVGGSTMNHSYKLIVTYNSESWNYTASYAWKPYDWTKYFGVSSVCPLTDISQLTPNTPVSQGWGNGSIGYEGTVNCSPAGGFPNGGYPCYVFPKNLYNSGLKVIVGGFNMSDIEPSDITIGGKQFKAITFSIIQHGESITIKYTL